jgi:hypothetical protein
MKEQFESAEEFLNEAPRPLRRTPRAEEPYPVEALGPLLGEAALAIEDKIQVPLAMAAQSVLAAATLAVQAHADIELTFGQTRPLCGFYMAIGQSGERKSSADDEALQPIRKREAHLADQYSFDLKNFSLANEAYEQAKNNYKKKSAKNTNAKELLSGLSALGEPPAPPLYPMLTVPEPTYEGLCKYLQHGQPSMGIFSAEGGQFIGGHGMNKDNIVKTAAGLCGLWDGGNIKRMRSLDGAVELRGKRVSLYLMAQPDIANIMLADELLKSQGLLSRLLIVSPDTRIGTRLQKSLNQKTGVRLSAYQQKLQSILAIPLPLKDRAVNELLPRKLEMSKEAKEQWRSFADSVESKMAKGNEWEHIRAFANKIPEHAARLAAVLSLVDNVSASELTAHYMERGIKLAEYYGDEALRLHEAGITDPILAKAEKTLEWLKDKWEENLISLPDLYQNLSIIGDQSTAKAVVRVLENHGHLIRQEKGGIVRGERRREVWMIIKQF